MQIPPVPVAHTTSTNLPRLLQKGRGFFCLSANLPIGGNAGHNLASIGSYHRERDTIQAAKNMGQISKSPLVFRVSDSNLVDEHPKDLLDFAWLDQPPHIDQPREDHAETDQSAPERGDETDRASPDSEHQSDSSETDRDQVQAARENVQVDEKDGPSESGPETEQTQALEFPHSKNPPESEKEHAGEQGHSDNEVEVKPSVGGDDAREAHNQTSAEDETHHAPADETDDQDHEQESDETPVSGFAPSTGEQYLDMPMVFIEPTPIAYDTDESEEDFLHFFL